MKKLISLLLMLLLLGPAARGEEGLAEIACPQQGFVTACEAGLAWRWESGVGLRIFIGEAGSSVTVCRTAGWGTDWDGYFDGVLTPWLRARLGENLLEVGALNTYTLGEGVSLPGVMYAFLDAGGRRETLFRLFDGRWAENVCYTLRCFEQDADAALRALGTAVLAYRPAGAPAQPLPGGVEAPQAGLRRVECPAQGFSAVCDVDCATLWREGEGLYIFTREWGRPPYVLVNLAPGPLDAAAFLADAVTTRMWQRYGEDLLEVIDCGNLTVGGRVMPAYGYRYRLEGSVMYQLRLVENRETASVSYCVKFPEADEAARTQAMAALESVAGSLAVNGSR